MKSSELIGMLKSLLGGGLGRPPETVEEKWAALRDEWLCFTSHFAAIPPEEVLKMDREPSLQFAAAINHIRSLTNAFEDLENATTKKPDPENPAESRSTRPYGGEPNPVRATDGSVE